MERVCAERIIERLRLEFAGRVLLDAFFWEHEPMRATASFNDPENIPLTAEFDVVVCILWSRLGTMLSHKFRRKNGDPFPSGTAFEIETAIESYLLRNTPDILVYRRTQEVPMPANDPVEVERRMQQIKALNEFIKENFFNADATFKAAINEYRALGQFETQLEKPLRKLVLGYIERSADKESALPGQIPATYHGENPFRGLEAYDFEDAAIFFGRSQAIEDVLSKMRAQAASGTAFTLVHGASGSGKSSLMRAGVIPMMLHKSCVIEGVGCWGVATMTPGSSGDHLLAALAASLQSARHMSGMRRETGEVGDLAATLGRNPEETVPAISRALQLTAQEIQVNEALPAPPPARLVLLIDQFEQIFSDDRRFPKEQRKAFAKALEVLARSGTVWVVATMRSDQLGRLAEDLPELAALSQAGQHALLAPTEMDMDLMIRLPARAAGVVFEEDPVSGNRLEARLLREARDAPDGLPLLSFVLRELYAKRKRVAGVMTMTHADLDAMGGLEGAVTSRAQEIFTQFVSENGEVKDPLSKLSRLLVTVGRDGKGPALRRSAPLSAFNGAHAKLGTLVRALVEGRLLTQTSGAGEKGVVYVTHEALFRKWKSFAAAIESNRRFLLLRARAAEAATEWAERNHGRDFLWERGERLRDVHELSGELDDLDELEQRFVRESIASSKRRGVLTMVLSLTAVAGVAVASVWMVNRETASEKTSRTIQERQDSLEDLSKQLQNASAALSKEIWKDVEPKMGSYDEYDESSASSRTFPALDVLEISRRLLALDPKNKEAFAANVLARIHADPGMLPEEDAEATLKQMQSQWTSLGLPKNELLDLEAQKEWKNGDRDAAITSWTSYVRTPGLDSDIKRRLLARISSHLLEQRKWQELESLVNTAWSWEDNALAKIRRAAARMNLMKLDLASADYEAAKKAAPELREVLELGPEIERRLSHQAAIDAATKKLVDPSSATQPEPWLERAKALTLAKYYDAALEDIERASKIMGGRSTMIDFFRVLCLELAGKKAPPGSRVTSLRVSEYNAPKFINGEWKQLLELLQMDKQVASGPASIQTLLNRCFKLRYFGQPQYGLADADAALKLNPVDYWSHYGRGLHLVGLNRLPEALEEAQKLRQMQPGLMWYADIQADAEMRSKNYEGALATLNTALAMKETVYLYELRAKCLRFLKRSQEAELDDQAAMRLRRQSN